MGHWMWAPVVDEFRSLGSVDMRLLSHCFGSSFTVTCKFPSSCPVCACQMVL